MLLAKASGIRLAMPMAYASLLFDYALQLGTAAKCGIMDLGLG